MNIEKHLWVYDVTYCTSLTSGMDTGLLAVWLESINCPRRFWSLGISERGSFGRYKPFASDCFWPQAVIQMCLWNPGRFNTVERLCTIEHQFDRYLGTVNER